MRLIPKGIVGRTLYILIFGVIVIEIDLALAFWILGKENPASLNWIILAVVVITGIIVIAYFIANQLISPLQQISKAAQSFAADIDSPPIPEKGPIEVQQALRDFNQMQQDVKDFVNERMLLVAAISHDLRTPLTRIQLYLESITDEDKRQKALKEVQTLSTMIQSTLSFLKDESENEQNKQVDVSILLQSLCHDFTDTLGLATYLGPKHVIIQCKPIALKRAIGNLIENAIRYGNQAQVHMETGDTHIVVTISDTGPGLEISDLENVFTPFYRVEQSRNLNTGGVGLGLCITKTLVNKMGGNVHLENINQSGLRAKIVIPK